MTPDMKRLCEAVIKAQCENNDWIDDPTEAIVRAVLTALRDATGETERYAAGEWSRRNVEAMVDDILAEPATV